MPAGWADGPIMNSSPGGGAVQPGWIARRAPTGRTGPRGSCHRLFTPRGAPASVRQPLGEAQQTIRRPGGTCQSSNVTARRSDSHHSASRAAPHRRLSVFTRVPVPGSAKTRLVPPLSAAQAAALQQAMTGDLLERLDRTLGAAVPAARRLSREVRCDGPPAPGALDIPSGWIVSQQGSGDLGERLARAAGDAREDGVGHLLITGADAPLLPLALVETAFSRLADRDVLVAPADDGGYVLIALALARAPQAAVEALFTGIPWGTGAVCRTTAEAADRAGLRFGELAGHWDVDRPEDLTRLATEIDALPGRERPRRTAALLTAAGC